MSDPVENLLERLKGVVPRGKGWVALCPAHDDKNPSLKIDRGRDGAALIKCHAGCGAQEIVSAIELKMSDLFMPFGNGNGRAASRAQPKPKPVYASPQVWAARQEGIPTFYEYRNRDGELVMVVARLDTDDGKTFWPLHPSGDGWVVEDPPGPLTLYQLLGLADAQRVFVVEGEKCVDAATKAGLRGTTTSSHGSGSPYKTDWTPLAGKDVVILPDNDKDGRKYAQRVAALVTEAGAASVKIIELPGLLPKGDIVDYLAGLDDPSDYVEILALADAAEPWVPPKKAVYEIPEGTYHRTDLGNAEWLRKLHAHDLCFSGHRNSWFAYDGKRWAHDLKRRVKQCTHDVARQLFADAVTLPEGEERKVAMRWALLTEAAFRASGMLSQAEYMLGVDIDKFDADPWAFNCDSGTIDLKTQTQRRHRREDQITKLAQVQFAPKATCPKWLEFLNLVTDSNADVVSFLQQAVGYSLSGCVDERCIFVLYGTGRNGKSTFVDTVSELLGEYADTMRAEGLMQKRGDPISNDVARLKGLRFTAASEASEGARLDEGLIKMLAGNDRVTARFLYGEYFTFYPECKLWLSTNHMPTIRGTDDAIWDRIRLVPFTVRIEKPLPRRQVTEMFRAEMSGILNWALKGFRMWQSGGLEMPAVIKDAVKEYRAVMDVLGGFLDECCIVGRNEQGTFVELYAAYKRWAERTGEHTVTQRGFGTALMERGFQARRGSQGKAYRIGLDLRTGDSSEP
ncbi:hypothetical protein LCGC14_0898340 [marine sediment metagenome]|uniref:SF3 helicase domain-containing protein n=1 Tax=marine sediment metagenome TaxID=412755 RepID=A0A0F9PHW0_9ZZZZ